MRTRTHVQHESRQSETAQSLKRRRWVNFTMRGSGNAGILTCKGSRVRKSPVVGRESRLGTIQGVSTRSDVLQMCNGDGACQLPTLALYMSEGTHTKVQRCTTFLRSVVRVPVRCDGTVRSVVVGVGTLFHVNCGVLSVESRHVRLLFVGCWVVVLSVSEAKRVRGRQRRRREERRKFLVELLNKDWWFPSSSVSN